MNFTKKSEPPRHHTTEKKKKQRKPKKEELMHSHQKTTHIRPKIHVLLLPFHPPTASARTPEYSTILKVLHALSYKIGSMRELPVIICPQHLLVHFIKPIHPNTHVLRYLHYVSHLINTLAII